MHGNTAIGVHSSSAVSVAQLPGGCIRREGMCKRDERVGCRVQQRDGEADSEVRQGSGGILRRVQRDDGDRGEPKAIRYGDLVCVCVCR